MEALVMLHRVHQQLKPSSMLPDLTTRIDIEVDANKIRKDGDTICEAITEHGDWKLVSNDTILRTP